MYANNKLLSIVLRTTTVPLKPLNDFSSTLLKRATKQSNCKIRKCCKFVNVPHFHMIFTVQRMKINRTTNSNLNFQLYWFSLRYIKFRMAWKKRDGKRNSFFRLFLSNVWCDAVSSRIVIRAMFIKSISLISTIGTVTCFTGSTERRCGHFKLIKMYFKLSLIFLLSLIGQSYCENCRQLAEVGCNSCRKNFKSHFTHGSGWCISIEKN